MKTSTKNLFKLLGKNLYLKIDGYLYLKYITQYVSLITRGLGVVSKIINSSNAFIFRPVIKYLTSRYHGKVILLNDAKKIVNLNKDIAVPDDLAKSVIPYDMAYRIIFQNPDSIVAARCACRDARNHDCQPANKCLIIGEPFASFMMEHNKKAKPMKISVKEAVEILDTCKKKGYVTNAYCKDGAGNRMYAICNCCPECCVSITAHKLFNSIGLKESSLAQSGYIASVNEKKCKSKGTCIDICPFGALSWKDGKKKLPVVNQKLCMGCGNCAEACPEKAIIMKRVADKGIPLDIHELVPGSKPVK